MHKFRGILVEHKWFFISLALAVFLMFFKFNNGIVQQDNYVGYAREFPNSIGAISFFDSRLLPGLPFLIYLIGQLSGNYFLAGYMITILSFIGSYYLLYKITGSKLSILPLVFPPVLLNLATLIDTEFPFIFLMILSYYLIKKEKLYLAFMIIGLSVWFRLAGVALIFGIFVYFLIEKKITKFFIYLPYFLIPVVLLLIYNVYFFGSKNVFYQLMTYEALHPGRISVGVIQLGADLIRALRWHWYRIFLSGLFYIIFFAALWIRSMRIRSLEFWLITGIYIFTLTVNLVPFLENVGRYLAPTVPLFWIIFYSKFKSLPLSLALLTTSALIVVL
jgi:hypothetical protein